MSILKATMRDSNVKVKKLRREGLVPGCIFGPKLPNSLSIQLAKKDAEWLHRTKGEKSEIEIELQGERMITVVDDISKDSIKDEILHISFYLDDKKEESKNGIG